MVSLGAWSLWQHEIRARLDGWATEGLSAREPSTCTTLIVGAGLAGGATAAALHAAGHDVLLVDAHGPATGASGRNAGFVLLGNAVEYPHLVQRFGRDTCRTLLRVARRNHALIRDRYAASSDYEASGSLMLSMPGDAREIETLQEATELLREDGVDLEFGTPGPGLAGFAQQLTIREDGQVHPAKLGVAITEACPRRVLGRVVALDWPAGIAEFEGGARVRFEQCVVATNAWTRNLLPKLTQLVRPERGQVLATAPLPERVLHAVAYAGWGFDYFRQRADGRVILGGRRHLFAEEESSNDASITAQMQSALDDYLAKHLPFAAGAPVTHRWAGIMGFSHDELPYVDVLPDTGGRGHLIAAFTGHGLGLTLACGELTAARICGYPSEDQAQMLSLFSLARANTPPVA